MVYLNFETITPLHISNGNQLAFNLDYVIVEKENKIAKLNISRVSKLLADAKIFDFSKDYNFNRVIEIVEENKELFSKEDFEYQVFIEDSFDRYLQSEKRVGKKIIQEFINSNGRFYIPGSSIKGMLTTILNRDPQKNPLGINPNNPSVIDKFVITDSDFIEPVFFGVETVERPPSVNMITLSKDASFSSKILKTGNLTIENLKKSLSKYSISQLEKAREVVLKFKERERKKGGATNYYNMLEKMLYKVNDFADDEYLVNLGFGGGSYFKLYENAEIPKFKNSGKRGKKEEAHTTFYANIENELYQLGWCKLKIEEK